MFKYISDKKSMVKVSEGYSECLKCALQGKIGANYGWLVRIKHPSLYYYEIKVIGVLFSCDGFYTFKI